MHSLEQFYKWLHSTYWRKWIPSSQGNNLKWFLVITFSVKSRFLGDSHSPLDLNPILTVYNLWSYWYIIITSTPICSTLGEHCQQNSSVPTGKFDWGNLDHAQTSARKCEGQSTEMEERDKDKVGNMGRNYTDLFPQVRARGGSSPKVCTGGWFQDPSGYRHLKMLKSPR